MEEKLNNLTMGQAVIFGVVVAVVYYFIIFDDGSDFQKNISNSRIEKEKVETEIQKVEKQIRDAERFRILAGELGEQMTKILNYIPQDLSTTDFMKTISEEAKVAGTSIEGLTGGDPQKTKFDFIEELNVTVTLKGSFGQLLTFMSYMTAKGIIVRVKSLTMNAGSTDPEGNVDVSFQAELTAYRYKEESEG